MVEIDDATCRATMATMDKREGMALKGGQKTAAAQAAIKAKREKEAVQKAQTPEAEKSRTETACSAPSEPLVNPKRPQALDASRRGALPPYPP
jgi:hypothetical protein